MGGNNRALYCEREYDRGAGCGKTARPLVHLIEKGRARSTLKKQGDYLWALGGEIIRDMREPGFDENRLAYDLVLSYVDNLGGPYWRHASCEEDLCQYDSVCRALYQFLKNK